MPCWGQGEEMEEEEVVGRDDVVPVPLGLALWAECALQWKGRAQN